MIDMVDLLQLPDSERSKKTKPHVLVLAGVADRGHLSLRPADFAFAPRRCPGSADDLASVESP